MTAKRSGVRLLTCLGLATLMSCSSGSSTDTYPDSVDAIDMGNPTVVEAANSDGSAENAADKNLVSQGENTESNTFVLSNQSGDRVAATPVSNDSVVSNPPTAGLVAGMPYIEARAILMQQGWIPLEQPEPGPYGVERTMYDLGGGGDG